jgi:hypothetical protein
MATLFKSAQSQAARPGPSLSQAGQAVGIRGFFALTAATVLNDTFQLVKLPANTVVEDLILDTRHRGLERRPRRDLAGRRAERRRHRAARPGPGRHDRRAIGGRRLVPADYPSRRFASRRSPTIACSAC